MRAIEIQASYAAAALAELKQWLAITTTTGEDVPPGNTRPLWQIRKGAR